MEKIAPNLYSFPITLPNNPLRYLNCYVIKGERNLLIDTGFNMPQCREDLLKGMEALELRPEETDVFLTHVHTDHTGNAVFLQGMGCTLYMSAADYEYNKTECWPESEARFYQEGVAGEHRRRMDAVSPGNTHPGERFTAIPVHEGSCLEYGGYTLETISTPGHTPGHMCLYDRESETMFLGDHVLFDITPNITFWPQVEDSLGSYVNSLNNMLNYSIKLPLPAHRTTGGKSAEQRVLELLRHHRARLDEAEQAVKRQAGLTAYDIAGLMSWSLRHSTWADFPDAQRWYAIGETVAHLDYLVKRGRIRRIINSDGIAVYEGC